MVNSMLYKIKPKKNNNPPPYCNFIIKGVIIFLTKLVGHLVESGLWPSS